MVIREFRGITDLVIAEVTKDTVENFTTGTPEEFAGASASQERQKQAVKHTTIITFLLLLLKERERIRLQSLLLLFLWICLQKLQVNITTKQQA